MFLGLRIVPNFLDNDDIVAVNGHIDFTAIVSESNHFSLFGEWEYFPNTYISNPSQIESLSNPLYVQIPFDNIVEAQKKATFKINVKNVNFDNNAILYLQYLDTPIDVYLNGVKQHLVQNIGQENLTSITSQMYTLTSYDESKTFQEIVLSIEGSEGSAPLFKRVPVIIGANDANIISFWKATVEAFLFGFMIFIVLNGFSFMILRPNLVTLTCISIFDTILIVRLFFASESLQAILESLFSFIRFSDTHVFTAQLILLFIGGIVGIILTTNFFDKERRVSKKLLHPLYIAYGFLIFIVLLDTNLYYTLGRPISIVVYLYSFIIVAIQITGFLKTSNTRGGFFNIIRTAYIGIVMALDLFFLGTYIGFPVFYYPLFLFFYAQMIMKLIDNSNSYLEVSILNKNLEKLVEERTKELSDKNKKLSEISTRDPLTSAYNRLYFDEQFEIALMIFNDNIHTLHLCMFDLDHFKSINDTYGHAVGDEQLIYVAKTVQDIVLKNSVFARVGGEEFMILYTEANTDVILENVELIRSTFEKKSKENKQFTTSSFGLTKYKKEYTKKDFLKLADKNLYEAKNTGRNKIVFN